MTMTSTLSYFKRLGLHGSRLLWRVLMVLVTVVGYSLVKAAKSIFSREEDEEENPHAPFGVYADGTPWDSNVTHTDWEACYGDGVNRKI